jgi:hypothetical protein
MISCSTSFNSQDSDQLLWLAWLAMHAGWQYQPSGDELKCLTSADRVYQFIYLETRLHNDDRA